MSQQKEIGTLVVVVLKAQHLHQPSFYKQDPYAQVSLSSLKKRTKVDPKGGQHPVWDDEFRFPVLADVLGKDKTNRTLEISCYKHEQRGEDTLLGTGTVDIEETLKSGEFDDWVQLETSAGARGEIYLEMTFYANSPPPLTRRPTKFSPSDRLARPAAYFTQEQGRQSTPNPTPPTTTSPPQVITGDRRSYQPPASGAGQIPSSLIPARGNQPHGAKQAPSNGGATSVQVVAVKHKDSPLPPPPANNDSADISSGKNLGLPSALHPGGRSGPRPATAQNQNRVTGAGRPSSEILPDNPHRRSLSDTSAPHAVPSPPFSRRETAVRAYTSHPATMVATGVGSMPSIFVEVPSEDHSRPAFPIPLASPLGLAQEYDTRGVSGPYDSSTYGPPPGHVYVQPGSQAYIPAPNQPYPRSFSPSQPPMPFQSLRAQLGQPQQLFDVSSPSPPSTSPSPLPQQYAQYSGSPTVHPVPPHQTYPHPQNTQPQLQLQPSQYSSCPLQQTPHPPPPLQQQQPHQQPYLSLQQHNPQFTPYTQIPHLPQAPQQYQEPNYPGFSPGSQPVVAPPQQSSLYSQTQPQQSYIAAAVPPPPPPPPPPASIRSPSSQPVSPHQPQSQLSSPLPPPPPLYGQGPSIPVSAARQSEQLKDIEQQGSHEDSDHQSQIDEDEQQHHEDLWKQEELRRQEEDERERLEEEVRKRKDEDELKRQQEEERRRQEEHRIREEEECRRIEEERKRQEEEERRIREEEECRREEEERRREEEECRREEEERKRQEEERRKQEEERRIRGEEERRRQEEERKRQQEEERKMQEEERRRMEEEERRRQQEECRKKEEERIQREREEAERRRAEEAEAERRWQEELARIRARAEQEAADTAFVRAQMEAEEVERRKQEEVDLALVRQVQEEAELEERVAQERRRQEEADMEVARREQAHEEELEKRRQEERRRRVEEADLELARRLDVELNLRAETSLSSSDQSRQRRTARH